MIVDTSAIVAVAYREEGGDPIQQALLTEAGIIPAPVLVELRRATALEGNLPHPDVDDLLVELLSGSVTIEPFSAADAELAAAAMAPYGRGNGSGGKLNLLDLMVYGMSKRTRRPVLCTGRDFASTDILLHPASRRW